MNEEKIYEDVVKAAFAKAQQTQIPNQKYKLASYLTTKIQEIANVMVASRTLVNYYDRYVEGKEATNKPKHENIEFLCQYLGFENYIEYIQSLLLKKEEPKPALLTTQKELNIPAQKVMTPISYRYHIILAVLFITGVLLSVHLSRQKECMIWVVDHYETIDCSVAQPQEQPQYVINRVISSKIDQFHSVTVTE